MSIRIQGKHVALTYDETGSVIEKLKTVYGEASVISLNAEEATEFIKVVMMAQAAAHQGHVMGMPVEMVFRPDDDE